jgi:AAA family ATP:ADP antiporter
VNGTRRSSPLDRLLRLFTDVRAGEGRTAVLLGLNIFLILTAYYTLKPVREGLILGEGSPELKAYMSAGQAILLIGAVKLYGWLTDRVPRRKLINVVTFFFIACLVVFYFLAQLDIPLGIVFFLWLGIFNLMVPAQFWSFANDVYTEDEGERLFPIVGFGASAGAVLGAVIAGALIGPLGVYQLMLLAGGVLLISLVATNYLDRRERTRTETDIPDALSTAELSASGAFTRDDLLKAIKQYELRDERERRAERDAERGSQDPGRPTRGLSGESMADELSKTWTLSPDARGRGAFQLVFRTRYLLLIAFLILITNWVNTTGEYILGRVVSDAAVEAIASGEAVGQTTAEWIGGFYAAFFGVVNVAGLLIQLFLVSRIVKYFGVRSAVLVLPVIALGAYALLAFYPVLALVRWAKTAENATDYSLQNTVKNMLFLPTTREEKYKAKQAIDTFFHRAGDVLSAVAVFVGTTFLAFGAGQFALFNVVLVLAWLVVAYRIGREYQLKTAQKTATR